MDNIKNKLYKYIMGVCFVGSGTFMVGNIINNFTGFFAFYIVNKKKSTNDNKLVADAEMIDIPIIILEKMLSKIKNKMILSLAAFYDKTTTFLDKREAQKEVNTDIIINTLNTGESARQELNHEIVTDTIKLSKKQAFKSYLYS